MAKGETKGEIKNKFNPNFPSLMDDSLHSIKIKSNKYTNKTLEKI